MNSSSSISDLADQFLFLQTHANFSLGNFSDYSSLVDGSEFLQQLFRFRNPGTGLLIGLYCVTFLVGIVGNFTVICVFVKNRHMKTVTNYFLVNLAACDLMVNCMCMPFSVALEVYANWIYGDVWCKLSNFCQGLAVISSILTLAVISAERFYAIHNPLKARAFLSKRRMQKLIVCVWVLAAAAASPSLIVRREEEIDYIIYTVKYCGEHWVANELKHAYNFTLLAIIYVGPLIFIVLGYLHIAVRLWTRNSDLHATPKINDARANRANIKGRRKVARMLFVMAILFAISWLPFNVISIILDFIPRETQLTHGAYLHILYSYSLWLAHCNSAINPICYCIMSQTFKKTLKANLMTCCGVTIRNGRLMSLSHSLTFSTPLNGNYKMSQGARSYSRVYLGQIYYKTSNMDDSCIATNGWPILCNLTM